MCVHVGRAKIAQYDSEFEVLAQKLDAFKCGYQDQEKLAGEVRQREEEIGQLQKSLSDMQIFLFQEREQVSCQTRTDHIESWKLCNIKQLML